MNAQTEALWRATADLGRKTRFPRLETDMLTDVLIVGAGFTGLTLATLLGKAGVRCVVLDKGLVGSGESGLTTAHLTERIDAGYAAIEKRFGPEGAREVATSARAAIAQIEELVHTLHIDCDFMRVPGFLFAEREAELPTLRNELAALVRAGVAASYEAQCPLPFVTAGSLAIEDQAQLDAGRYLAALADALPSQSCQIFENTRVLHVEEGELCRATTDGGAKIDAHHVVLATHVPWNRIALHMKLAAYRTYAIAYPAPAVMPDGLFDDCQTPYHYIRTQSTPRGRFLIVGGEDHKTGHERETTGCFERLESYARKHFALQGAAHRRWSGQILEPADGLPFIGRNAHSKHVYVATGFSGTGVTFGTLAAMLLRDTLVHCDNPWSELYAATRIKPLAQAKRYLAENVDFPAHVIGDRLARGDVRERAEVPKGQGKLVHEGGKMLAVYRDDAGVLHSRSAVCPHLGCHVRWNDAERSWDCPCHGSRFGATGQLRNGPAVSDLARPDTEDKP